MSKVAQFTGSSRLDTSPDRIFEMSKEVGPTDVVVVGWDRNGDFFFRASMADGAEANMLLDIAKAELLARAYPITKD